MAPIWDEQRLSAELDAYQEWLDERAADHDRICDAGHLGGLGAGRDAEADADRDRFLERARVGLTERKDRRPSAQSTYVYKSMRERYGLVRGRESILPFDLVFQGSLGDLSLGAFPRWRAPKPTSDSFLYR